jgi:NAD-dependent dihydropyrimidine dehydrogenase PreA subunit
MIYIKNVSTLQLDKSKCISCKNCIHVCPHRVFNINKNQVFIENINACIECGGCQMNCPVEAIQVDKGVGCATAIIQNKLKKVKILKRFVKNDCC